MEILDLVRSYKNELGTQGHIGNYLVCFTLLKHKLNLFIAFM